MKYKIMAFVLLFTLMGGGLSAQEEKPAAQPETEKRPISKPILKPKPAVVDEESSILSDI